MSPRRRLRAWLGVPVVAALAGILAWSYAGIPAFGDFQGLYGRLLNAHAVPQRHTTNVVTAIVFDYRGFDTMGEEFILFASVVGVVLLLRGTREPQPSKRDPVRSDAIRSFGVVMIGVTVLIGLWLAALGLVTPGGGFQGGVAVSAGIVLLYLTVGYRAWRAFGKEGLLDPFEAAGAGCYVIVGLAALVASEAFLHNLLGLGTPGTLLSGGSMGILNWAVAVEVAAANLVLYSEFLESYIVPHLPGR